MDHGSRTPVRTKFGALFMLVGLLTGTFSSFAPRVAAVAVTPDPAGTRTGFEIEGNQTSQVAGKLDWQALAGLTPVTDADSLTIITDDTHDSGLQGTSKENDPSGWVCNTGGNNPPKADIVKAAVNIRTPGTGGPFLDLAFVRSTGEGSSHVNFEFNQNAITNPCPHTGRTTGDLLLVVDFPGGSEAGNVEVYLWDSTISADGQWVLDNAFPANKAAAASNGSDIQNVANDITDHIFGQGTITTRRFGEASIDLSAVLPTGTGTCVSFGEVNIRSRSSGSSIESALQDRLPGTPIDLSTCAKIKIKKVDNSVPPVPTAGAVYGLYDLLAKAQAVAGQTDAQAIAAALGTCTTGADGTCTFDDVNPDTDYWITEVTPPAGLLPSTEIRFVVGAGVDPLSTVDLTGTPFVNNVPVGNVTITKRLFEDGNGNDALDPGEQVTPDDASDLDGITFTLQQGGVTSKTHPAGADATCTITGGTGQCTISSVRLGTYDIVETLNPTGPSGIGLGASPQVTITTNGQTVTASYDNPLAPINISLDKKGVDWADVGETITYTFDVTTTGVPLTITDIYEVVDLPNGFDDRCTATAMTGPDKSTTIDPDNDGDALLEDGEKWRWTCQYTVTLADATDADGIALWNKATVEGEDDLGREVSADDTHLVRIKLPDVSVEKTPDDGVINPGQNAVFTIKVANKADDGIDPPEGIARYVTLTDTLPAGITWSENSAECSIAAGVLTCDFGDLAPGAEKTVTVTGATTVANCGRLPNTATASATNELQSALQNNSDDALVTVSCADVTVDKVADEDPINAGDTASFDITVTNLSATAAATGVTLSDTLPTGVSWTLSGPDAGGCGITAGVLACDFGSIEASGTRTVTVSGLTGPDDCGTLTNTAVVSSTNEARGTGGNNTSTDTIDVQCPDVWVEKGAGSATVNANDTITWTITFGNEGPGDAYGVTLTDVLPAGLTGYVLGGTDAAVCELSAGTVTCDLEVMDVGAEYEITITGTTDAADCGLVTNPVSIAADNEHADDDANNEDSSSVRVQCPDVWVAKTGPASVSSGDSITWTITFGNEGPGDAYGFSLTDYLPTGLDGYVLGGADAALCGLTGTLLSCDIEVMGATTDYEITITGTTDEPDCGQVTNPVSVEADNEPGSAEGDNSDESTVAVLCPGVNLAKAADDPIVEAGGQIGFTITITNLDDDVPPAEGIARDVVVVDELPSGLDWAVAHDSDLPPGGTCDIEEGVLECDLGDLEAVGVEGAPQVTIHLVADTTPADCAVYDNTATATVGNGADPDDADATSRVRCPISIDLDKAGDELAHVGDVVDYEFTVTNDGGEDLLAIELTDLECDAGTITLVDDGDGDEVLAAGTWDPESEAFGGGEVWAYTCERTLTEDDVVVVDGEDFALNTGLVRGEDADGREATDDDPHVVEIITPDIDVDKTVDDATPDLGQTVRFTYGVANTGDTTLYGVEVVDDQLGPVGTVAQLEPGESSILTMTMVVAADSPIRNVATATGEDILGLEVSDEDDATIGIVLPTVIPRVLLGGPQQLPRTGADADVLLVVAGSLLLLGGFMVATGGGLALRPARRRGD